MNSAAVGPEELPRRLLRGCNAYETEGTAVVGMAKRVLT
jgi:hypothetical protein